MAYSHSHLVDEEGAFSYETLEKIMDFIFGDTASRWAKSDFIVEGKVEVARSIHGLFKYQCLTRAEFCFAKISF